MPQPVHERHNRWVDLTCGNSPRTVSLPANPPPQPAQGRIRARGVCTKIQRFKFKVHGIPKRLLVQFSWPRPSLQPVTSRYSRALLLPYSIVHEGSFLKAASSRLAGSTVTTFRYPPSFPSSIIVRTGHGREAVANSSLGDRDATRLLESSTSRTTHSRRPSTAQRSSRSLSRKHPGLMRRNLIKSQSWFGQPRNSSRAAKSGFDETDFTKRTFVPKSACGTQSRDNPESSMVA